MNDVATLLPSAAEYRQGWLDTLRQYSQRAEPQLHLVVEGRLTRMVGLTLEARGFEAPIGARCLIQTTDGDLEAEVVGFAAEQVYLMPTGELRGLVPNARVIPSRSVYEVHAGEALLGRVIDAAGQPLDDKGPLQCTHSVPLNGRRFNPLNRKPVHEPLDVGVAAINALLSVGRGQRLGLFAGSGVGKSVLMGMMTKFTEADVIVVGLIGERGREVKEFVDDILGEEGQRRAVVVAAPADNPPLMRLHGAWQATSIAEYFRDQGYNVLLLMDSLTRFAQAQREVALAIGEPPATKGYPPSVFARLPQLVERAGNGVEGGGSITAFYTVLAEGDDQNDPVVDSARAILDGHIVLSRDLAEAGHYPAIDIEASISRVMERISKPEHVFAARRFKQIYSAYRKNQDLINVGAYQKGSDPKVDEAIRYHSAFNTFLQQEPHQAVDYQQSVQGLLELSGNAKAISRPAFG